MVFDGGRPKDRGSRFAVASRLRFAVEFAVPGSRSSSPVPDPRPSRVIPLARPRCATLDRYVFREILPPFFLALLIFTFLLVLPPVMDYLENLLAKGVTWGTAARILWTLAAAGARPDHPDGGAGRDPDRARPDVRRPRVGGAAGLRRQPLPAAAADRRSWRSSPRSRPPT